MSDESDLRAFLRISDLGDEIIAARVRKMFPHKNPELCTRCHREWKPAEEDGGRCDLCFSPKADEEDRLERALWDNTLMDGLEDD